MKKNKNRSPKPERENPPEVPPPVTIKATSHGWMAEIKEMLQILIVPMIVFLLCKVMEWLGMDKTFIHTIEFMDQKAAIIIFGCFLLKGIRRAFMQSVAQ